MTPKEAIMKGDGPGTIVEFEDDVERILDRLDRAGFDVVPRITFSKRPIAFRWKNTAGQWCFSTDEEFAARMSDSYEGLYARDGTPNINREE